MNKDNNTLYKNIRDEVLRKTEDKANWFFLIVEIICFFVHFVYVYIDIKLNGSVEEYKEILACFVILYFICFIFFVVIKIKPNLSKFYKYVVISCLLIQASLYHILYSVFLSAYFLVPIFLSTRQYSKKFTILTGILSISLLTLTSFFNWILEEKSDVILSFHQEILGLMHYADLSEHLYKITFFEVFICSLCFFISYFITYTGQTLLKNESDKMFEIAEVSSEVKAAASIQLQALPSLDNFKNFKRLSVDALLKPAKDASGDFYDIIQIDEDHVLFLIADVSDKGLASSMFTIKTKQTIETLLLFNISLKEMIEKTNKILSENNPLFVFVSMFIGVLDLKTGLIEYINCGHPAPYIKTNKQVKSFSSEPQIVLGIDPNAQYITKTIKIKKDESLILYTDGATDAINELEEAFGENRLFNCIQNSNNIPTVIIDNIATKIESFSNTDKFYDDLTLLCFKYLGDEKKETYSIKTDGIAENTEKIINFVLDHLKGKCPEETRNLIGTAVDDVLSNVFEYGYKEIKGKIEVVITIFKKYCEICFFDESPRFNPLEVADPKLGNLNKIGGLGIWLFKNIMDETNYNYVNGKNVLTITKKWE